jgi:parvulin-like peptidyl-prolyl isomerase
VLAALALGAAAAAPAQPQPTPAAAPGPPARRLDQILAAVDFQVITVRDMMPWLMEARLANPGLQSATDEELLAILLPEAVDEILLASWAEFDLGDAAGAIAGGLEPERLMRRYMQLAGSPEKLRALLAAAGLREDDMRAFAAERVRNIAWVRAALARRLDPDEFPDLRESIADAIRVRVAHILIEPDGSSPEAVRAAEERALTVRREIAAGFPFERAALLYSDDKGTAARGGDIGWLPRESLEPALALAVLKLDIEGVSPPVATRQGFHLLKLMDFETEQRQRLSQRFRELEAKELERLRRERSVTLAPGFDLRNAAAPAIQRVEPEGDRATPPDMVPAGS